LSHPSNLVQARLEAWTPGSPRKVRPRPGCTGCPRVTLTYARAHEVGLANSISDFYFCLDWLDIMDGNNHSNHLPPSNQKVDGGLTWTGGIGP
jgi:hypothetical protein